MRTTFITLAAGALFLMGCDNPGELTGPAADLGPAPGPALSADPMSPPPSRGVVTANGWYAGEEIYYLDLGVEEGVTQRGENDLYLIGGNRAYQANVAEFIPGQPGYSPHWNIHLVNTAPGKTLTDILASPYASSHYPDALFDDVDDILAAEDAGLVITTALGVVVNCPIVSENATDAPGNTPLSEDFPGFPNTF
ncbi:MAG: hypothetical protein PVJ04_03365 [Gemmatimonadota bacterium]|jgi:hypothetical protein